MATAMCLNNVRVRRGSRSNSDCARMRATSGSIDECPAFGFVARFDSRRVGICLDIANYLGAHGGITCRFH